MAFVPKWQRRAVADQKPIVVNIGTLTELKDNLREDKLKLATPSVVLSHVEK